MKDAIRTVLAIVCAGCFAVASAQPAGMQGMGGMGLGPSTMCRDANDAAACEVRRKAQTAARQQAVDACKDVTGADRRRCINDVRMAAQDCTKAGNPVRCDQVKAAYARCRSLAGPEMRACMGAQHGIGK